MAEAIPQQSGIVIRSGDGEMYFVRDEILELCKVQADEVDVTARMIDEQEVSGFAITTAQRVAYGGNDYQTKILDSPNQYRGSVSSTVMCCW